MIPRDGFVEYSQIFRRKNLPEWFLTDRMPVLSNKFGKIIL